eukprot:51914_1
MVVLTDKCLQLCMNTAVYRRIITLNYTSVLLFALVGSAAITDNTLNGLMISVAITVCYGVIQRRRPIFDHTKYNSKSRHPVHQLIDELGWKRTYTNLLRSVQNTKGFVFKPDRVYASSYQIFNYFVVTIPQWDEYNILCRGLILDPTARKVVATSFPKFFNFQEFHHDIRKQLMQLFVAQKGIIQINEKLDGSLGIIFYCDTIKRWRCSTRGSMGSDQAMWATEYLKKHQKVYHNILVKGHTYLAEIVYKENKILIDYDFEGLVLLAAYNDDGYEYKYEYLQQIAEQMFPYFRISKRVRFNSVNELIQAAKDLEVSKEGWVVAFECGMRVKFKGKEYLALAKVAQNITRTMVQRVIVEDGLSEEALLNTIPEEFHDTIHDWYVEIWNEITGKSRNVAYDLIATKELCKADLGKLISGKTGSTGLEIKWKSSNNGRLTFLARKTVDDSIWKCDVDDHDLEVKVDQIVNEMMKDKNWRKRVRKSDC